MELISSSTFPGSRLVPGRFVLSLVAAAVIVVPGMALAQDTTAVRQDTTGIRGDTAQVASADSVLPPVLPELVSPFTARRSAGVWHWDQEALAATAAISVLDLLDEIPGIATFRSGLFLQPEAASAYGGTSARIEVDLDGYVLDPLDGSSLDLSTIELSHLSEVLVERRLDVLRIRLRSAAASAAQPYSRVEAGLGQPNANLFRGVFLAPRVLIGPVGFAIQRLDTDGARGREPADVFDAWFQWGWQSERRGVQFELRQFGLDREPDSPWLVKRQRRDIVLRARNRFGSAVTAEAYVGRSRVDVDPIDAVSDTAFIRSGVQSGIRASLGSADRWLEASLRTRDEPELPRLQADLGAGFALDGVISARADVGSQSWRDAGSMVSLAARADFGPFAGVVPFFEWTRGERGAPLFDETIRTGPLIDDRSAIRVGAEGSFPWLSASGAVVRVNVDSVPAFGLPFDRAARMYPGGAATGFEVSGRVRLYFDWLAAEGSYVRWRGDRWAYLPVDEGFGALRMNWLPLPSGNLEIIGRLEARRRGNVLAPDPADAGLTLVNLPARAVLNSYLQIRIMDVRLFMRYENLTGQQFEYFLGQPNSGPRLFYGVKWEFWN